MRSVTDELIRLFKATEPKWIILMIEWFSTDELIRELRLRGYKVYSTKGENETKTTK